MSDKEILDRYVDLDKSCLTDEEMKERLWICYVSLRTHSV